MANYYARCRTNYFHVTDEAEYEKLFRGLRGVGCDGYKVKDFSKPDPNSKESKARMLHGFGCEEEIGFTFKDEEYPNPEDIFEIEDFIDQLRKILPEDEVFVYELIGYEKLCYLTSFAIVASRNEMKTLTIDNEIQKAAFSMVGENANYAAEY